LRTYPIADLRKGVSADDLGNWLSELLLASTPRENVGLADMKIERDQLLLKQPPWVHAVMSKHLATLRERGKREPARPRTREDFTSIKAGLLAEAQRQTIRKQLAKRLSLEFLDLPAEDVLTFLKEAGGINLWLGRTAAKKRGIRLDKPVTLKSANETLANLLDTVLTPVPLDWYVLEPGLIMVEPALEGAVPLELRVYGIQELRHAGHTLEGLLSLATNIDAGSWAASGGPGSMRKLSPGLLIVNQTRRIHNQIDTLFDKLAPDPRGPGK
jgi:hypothetical protein